jgi:hypothetical protein
VYRIEPVHRFLVEESEKRLADCTKRSEIPLSLLQRDQEEVVVEAHFVLDPQLIIRPKFVEVVGNELMLKLNPNEVNIW